MLAKLRQGGCHQATPDGRPTTLMRPGVLYKFQVVERYKNSLTLDGSKQFLCQVSSPLTLSAGTLISKLSAQAFVR